jgi:hypothetical protein
MHLEHEAVHLRFGQGIGAFLLDRVLGGHDQERIGQREGFLPMVTWRSCMASSSALCTLAGARLISSARMMLANTGPFFVVKEPSLGL